MDFKTEFFFLADNHSQLFLTESIPYVCGIICFLLSNVCISCCCACSINCKYLSSDMFHILASENKRKIIIKYYFYSNCC